MPAKDSYTYSYGNEEMEKYNPALTQNARISFLIFFSFAKHCVITKSFTLEIK